MSGVLSTASGQRGFMEFSPTRNGDKTDKENVAVLSLVLFSKAPFVSFGTVKTGTSKSTILRIENPTSETEAVVTVVRIPSSKGFSVDTNTFTIQPQDSFSLTISWTPTEEGGIRELIIFSANGVLKHQAVLLGKAEASKKKKKSLWDAIKNKKRGEKGSPYRAKKIVPPTKMAASKTVVVSRKPPYEQEKLQGPLSPLNDVKTGRNKSISEHTLLDDEPLKSEQQRCLKPIQNQSCLVDQENVHPGQRRSSLLLATNETVMRGSSRSLPGTVDNKNLTKMLNKTLSPIGTPERLKKLMPQIQPVEHTACVSLNTVHSGPVISLHDALTLINSDLALVNSSSKSSSPSCEFSDSLEFKSEDHDHFKACPDSPELSDSTESRLTFFVRKNVDVPKVEKPLDKPKKMSFNCETVIKNKALVTSCGSGQKIKKSRRRLLEKTLELLEDSSQSEHGPGTPNLPVIELDIKTEGSERVGSLCDDFKDGPTLRLDDAQMFINTHVSSPPSSAHWSVSTSSPSNSPPMTFTSSSPLHLGQSSPLHCSNTSNPLLTVPAQKTDIPPQLIPANQSTQEELFPVHMVTDSRKRKHEECLRGVMTIGHGEKNNPVKMTKMVSWKSEHIESAEEKTTSQRQPVKVNGHLHLKKTSAKTRRSSVSAQKKPSSSKLPLRGAASVKSSKAQSVKCVKMSAVAMRKLTFVKPTQTAIPRHPLPFAAKNMFYDERWIEKQERGFTWWLNYILTPDDFKVNTEMTKVNAAPLTMVCSNNISVSKAPTKEEMSFSTYTARRKLNRLRRAACQIFTSETMVKAIKRLELEVEAKRLRIRKDRHLWKDIGERQKVLNWLLSYNPLWLRIGLETIFGELISLESNSDSTGLAMFILQRLLWNPDIAAEFRHPKVPHLYKDGHEEALSSFTLKKLLLLVCFLDKAKESRLIEHNPCLFCVDGEFKTSKDLLLAFSRDFLSGEGILPRHLGYLGLSVSHVQTPLDEFDFSVMNLAVDLKCGIRLVRVMELLIKQWDLSAKLRLPAISRLQKIHNMDIALQVLKIRGVDLKDEYGSIIDSRDIVDGHREKTLSLLWKIIFSFQVEVVLDEDQLREEIIFLKRTLRTKQKLASLRAGLGLDTSGLKTKVPFEHSSTKVVLLMEWARAVCDFYNLTLENFTVTFSDGRVLCYLIHHYHPGLITAESVHHYTTQTVDCSSRGRLELNCSATDSDNSFDSCPTGLNGLYPAMKFAELLENEKSNFSLVNTAVAFLGGVPAMINPADMSNTIPNEKVVMSYLSFLCARLLDLRNETRAARVIQGVWRNYRLKKDLQCYKERNMAAVKIQAAVRHFLQRHRAKKQYAASTIIKSAWRGFVTRKKLQIEKEKELWIIRERAATIIQAQWRMFSALTYYQNLRYKTIVVQSQWRMKRAVFAYGRIYCATTVLQRYLKAFIIGRKEHTSYLSLKAAVLKIQRGYRRWKIQKTQRENHAARVLQTAFRKWYIEKIAKRAAAAIKIQSFYRMQRCLYQYRKIQRSALFIQAHYRGHAQRCQYQKHKQQLNAAIVIQSAFRGYCVRKKALRLKYATVLIQRWYRASARRNVERQLFLKMCCAARTIQVAYRRKRACNSLKQHRAATAIQAAFRKFVTRRRYLALRKATVVIQQKRRATILSRRTKEDYETLKKAVLIIQANWRGRADRMRLEKSHQCATLIKAHYLRYKAQVEFRSKKAAAVVIQRHYQAYVAGKKTRTAFLQKRAACVKIAAGYRGMKVRTDLKEKHKSAVVIQAAFRMYLMRKQYILIQSATIIIQSRYRALLLCRAHRHKYEELKKAALKIQTIYRGWRQREEFKKRDNAARVIQALFKMHRVHMAYVTMKCAAIILQERFRAKMLMDQQLKKYRTMKSAAIIIQAAYRGHRTRVKIAQMQRAAIVLQRKFLTMRERNKFLAIRSATLAFQQRYRAVILMREEREHYLSKCRLVIFLQAALRGYIIRKQLGIKHSAAVKIQSNFRRYLQTNYYRRLRWASGVLQARYKANKEIRREKQALTAKRHAVIVLQSAVRGMICRKMIKRKQKASSIIQRAFRAHFEHKKYITLKSSVLAVQRRFRATQAAKAAMQHYQNLHKSAVIIQAAYRGLRVRKDVACWHQAATLIQSTFRMHREEVKFQDLRLSTIIIQKYYRAHLLQKKDQRYYLKVRSSAITLQAAIRGLSVRRRIAKMHRAATIVQANFKRHKQQLVFRKQCLAARVIQQRFRALRQRNLEMKRYQEFRNAACYLQSAFRRMKKRHLIKQRYQAATVIQSAFRGHREKRKFQAMCSSTITIQRYYRAYILQKKERDYFMKIRSSIICLQTAFRGHLERRRIAKMHRAATIVQAHFKRHRQQLTFKKQLWAVRILQQRVRALRQRNLEKQRYQEVKTAVIRLQAAFRGMKTRRSIKRWQQAATVIQSAFRGHREKIKFQAMCSSAITIQTYYRAYNLQKNERYYFMKLRSSIICLQAAYRGHLERRRIAKMHKAATIVQAHFKRHRQQLTFKKQLWAVCILQQRVRGLRQRNLEKQRYQEVKTAVTRLQAAFRGMKTRRSIKRWQQAATVIQSVFRGRREKMKFQSMCSSAITIQRYYRAYILQKKERDYFMKIRSSIICLQAAYRGQLERQRIAKMHRAATIIQAHFKRHRQQLTFKKQLWAICILQQRVRALRQRHLEQQRYQEVKTAVIRLQAAFRGMKTRRAIKQLHLAATVIQSVFRGRREKMKFQSMCSSAVTIQRYYRSYVLQKKQRYYFLKIRSSVIFLQAIYRGCLERQRITKMHRAATIIQAYFKRHQQQLAFKKQLWAISVLQQRFRALRQRNMEVKHYEEVRNAVFVLQAAFRGMKSRKFIRQMHLAATTIQATFRAHCKLKRYLKIKSSALTIQQRFRSARAAKSQRKRFLELCNAAIILQAHFRGKQTRKFIVRLHQAATVIQLAYRKHVILQILHASVVVIQKHYRAFIRQRQERTNFLKMKWAAVILQAAYRGHCVRRDINQQNGAACLIQSYWRCSVQRRIFQKKREAAVKLQERFRAMQVGNVERKRFVRIRQAAVTLQSYYRDWVVRKQEHEAAIAQRRLRFAGAVFHHLCAIKIQRALRAYWTLKTAKTQIHSVIIIQNLVRMVLQKRRYLADRRKVVTAQRAVRRWLARRHKSALVIQCATRKFLLLRRQKKVEKGIVKAQALWRGHVSRKLNDSTKVIKLRQKLRKVSAGAREEDKLRNKTSSALDCILRYKHFSSILEALKNLEATTRLSPVCCEHLVESGATSVIFTLIISCNRSVPCMDVITYSIQILLNLSKYHKTIEAVYAVENSVNILVDLLQTYRGKAGDKVGDKGKDIFTKACFLLVLLLQDKCRAEEVVKCPKILDKIKRIYSLTIHKHNMDTERNVTKQKMAASVNGSFYVPATPRKTRPVQKFAPDWVLRKDKLKNIVDPLEAIKMLASALFIVL
ncbi:abnormal spindle-like microcephaly-associated protein [Corythoichthys intestinalis]|uniref:abnormal spindle-like microcephaly-associated protein n=1 Tax=Corythoichthys intestinalis TaxID=161448 RepID=UPI0025A53515|nr:abnormal spindle-like microcephaly-associated protein [Corythoichthys intestinalis]